MPDVIGSMREQIVVQSASTSADAEGQLQQSWSTYKTVWARVEPIQGYERDKDDHLISGSYRRFTVNHRTDITLLMRVSWSSSFWNITDVQPSPDKKWLTLVGSRIQ